MVLAIPFADSGCGGPRKNTQALSVPGQSPFVVHGTLLSFRQRRLSKAAPPVFAIGPESTHWPQGGVAFAQPPTANVARTLVVSLLSCAVPVQP
jgi:hypothetical protein